MATRPRPLPTPIEALMAATPPVTFRLGSSSRTMLMASGSTPPPAPWSTRATTSQVKEWVETASAEPATRPASEISSIGLRPRRSPKRPSRGVSTAADSRLAVISQVMLEPETSSSLASEGRIGTTAVCTTLNDSIARMRAGRTRALLCFSAAVVGCGASLTVASSRT
ncbi:hypothetical protein GCM10009639_51660 [Kitasatospora putterlickiae]|uniref:Uncharacterized protein n=1 Tax=Kitasatospora putterlickiae TaxID=221725 RepID=A0ABN1YD31_9ACTN